MAVARGLELPFRGEVVPDGPGTSLVTVDTPSRSEKTPHQLHCTLWQVYLTVTTTAVEQ